MFSVKSLGLVPVNPKTVLFFYYFDRSIIIIVICLVDGGMPVMEGGTCDMLMVMNHVRHFKCFLKDYNQIHLMTVLFNRKIGLN